MTLSPPQIPATSQTRLEGRPTPRFDTIDILRGLSILAVVLLHAWLRMHFAGFDLGGSLPTWLSRFFFRNGGNGVTVFFAVSGFLITLTSIRRFGSLAAMRPAAFYRVRFARIAPLLLLTLAVLSVLHLASLPGFRISPKQGTLPRALFAALTFHLNWFEAVHGYLPANWDVLWSLSVEEMFYLFFPILAAFRLRRGSAALVVVLMALVAAGPFARTVWSATGIAREKSYLGGMAGIALGCLAALLVNHWQRRQAPPSLRVLIPAQIVGSALIFWIALWPPWHWMRYLGRSGLDDTVLALGACMVMVPSVLHATPGRRWTAPARWFGRHSYEVYLTHEFIVVWGTALYLKLHRGPLSLWLIAIVGISAALGAIIARFFSEPLNRLLRGSAANRMGLDSPQEVPPRAPIS